MNNHELGSKSYPIRRLVTCGVIALATVVSADYIDSNISEARVVQIEAATGEEAEFRRDLRLAEQATAASSSTYTPETYGDAPRTEETIETIRPIQLSNPAPDRVIIEKLAIDFPIVYTDFDRGITNEGGDSAPFNDPPTNREFESLAIDRLGLDSGAKLGALVNRYLETGQLVEPDEQIKIGLVTHRSSTDPEAAGNGMINNQDVDPATYGEGLQVGDEIRTRFAAGDQDVDVVWTIVQHPAVFDTDGTVIGEPTDGSPSWLLPKDSLVFEQYNNAVTSIFKTTELGINPIIENTFLLPSTSHKGNGIRPANKPTGGSIYFAQFVAVPTAVEVVSTSQ